MCVEYSDSTTLSIQALKDEGYAIYGVELCHESVDYKDINYPSPCALVLGNERKGVSEAALQLTQQQIHISMYGMGNSLNVSTAGAIVLAECASQIRQAVSAK